jgi:hypothetical protein
MEKHPEMSAKARTFLIGRVSALIHEVVPAQKIVDDMVNDAAVLLNKGAGMLVNQPKAKL